MLLTHPGYCFFHTSHWARVLHESYGYEPAYFVSTHGGRLEALIPLMRVRSILSGHRAVSLPFSDFCPILCKDERLFKALLEELLEYGRQAGWRYIELRGADAYLRDEPAWEVYRTHTVFLERDQDQVFSRLRSSTRRGIRKAIREGVRVELSARPGALKEFYRLNCMTRRRHGLPPQPFHFFQKVYQYILREGNGLVALAIHGRKPVAGAVFFHVGRKALFKYGASDMRYQSLRANNLVMWEAIRRYCDNGFQSLSLGRTAPGNEGLLRFKTSWGAVEEHIAYHRLEPWSKIFLTNSAGAPPSYHRLARVLPGFLLRLAGSVLYKHMA